MTTGIDINILVKKLECYGIRGNTIYSIQSTQYIYLGERKHFVNFAGYESS